MYLARCVSRGLTRRFSTTPVAASMENYVAVNEPIYGYEKGSKERAGLEAKLHEFNNVVQEVPIVIGDQEIRTDEVKHQVRPFDHQNPLAKYYWADPKLIQKAIDVSQVAHGSWERTPQSVRSEIFKNAADLLAGKYRHDLNAATMLGQGKTVIQAEIDAACELTDFYRFNAQWAMDLLKWDPISTDISHNKMYYRGMEGFWAAVAPFNFTAISGHLAGAPASVGNVVLWKPSNTAVLSSWIVFKALREAGLPPGVIAFLPTSGSAFGDTCTNSPHLAGINFTGSAGTFHHLWKQVGNNIEKYVSFPRLVGECGGKNFHLVHPSANITSVTHGTIRSAFEYSGQKCSACSRMYVPESRWDELREGLVENTKQVKLGSVMDFDTFLSAVIDGKAFDRIASHLDRAKKTPALKILAGGHYDKSKGFFIEPTIIQTTDPRDLIMEEELFGPVLTVYVYKDSDYSSMYDLVDTTSPFSLTGSIYAEDPKILAEAQDRMRHMAGNFYVNDRSTGSVVSQQPFGGARQSGTNDKAGGPHYVLRFCSPLAVKTTNTPSTDWRYPYMET